MKKTSVFFAAALLLLGGCAKAALIDLTLNSFSASATKDLDDRVRVSWITNGYFKSYQVLRSGSSNGTYTPVSDQVGDSAFEDKTVPRNTIFYYKVRAFNAIGIPLFTTAEPAEGLAGKIGAIAAPSRLKVSLGESVSKIILRWERVDGAFSYNIYRSKDPHFFASESLMLARTPYLEYEDFYADYADKTPMEPGDVFYYKVAAVDAFDTAAVFPSQDKETPGIRGSVFGVRAGALGLNANPGVYTDKVMLTWNSVPDVSEYIVYRSESRYSIGSQIAAVAGGAGKPYTNSDLSVLPGKIYYYTFLLKGAHENTIQQADEKAKGYLKVASAPAQPQNFAVSQGEDPQFIRLSWDPVPGATGYEISRSVNPDGGWEDLSLAINPNGDGSKLLAKDDPYTGAAKVSFSYYYKVVALNPAPGEESAVLKGWANKAPVNITASKKYGGRVKLNWDPVPGALKYLISYAAAFSGPYLAAGEIPPGSGAVEEYSHRVDISPDRERALYYKVAVQTAGGRTSDPSAPVEGLISKIASPENLQILNNKTSADQFLRLSWNSVPNAEGYRIYRATLMHRSASVSALRPSDYVKIADLGSRAFIDSLVKLPIRRYDYKVVALDADGDEGAAAYTGEAYRLPVNVKEFLQDVDQSIIEAQTRIPGFGNNGSSGSPYARAFGQYIFAAGTSAVSRWVNYTSFECTLNGNPDFSINMSSMSASQTGTVSVTGLYSGTVTYNGLVGAMGGYTTGGTITASYKGQSETYNGTPEAAGFLESVRSSTENAPAYPSYVKGGGGAIQPGGREQ